MTSSLRRLKTTSASDAQEGRVLRPQKVGEENSRTLLRLVRQHAPCSRADLVRLSGLTAPAVSAAVEKMRGKGLIRFTKNGASTGGRPPYQLEFNAACGYVAGVDIGGSTLRTALADLSGRILAARTAPLQRKKTPQDLVNLIKAELEHLCEAQNIPARKVLHLGVGAPGITNVREGIVVSAPNLSGWHEVPLRDLLENAVGISCSIENDVNLAAWGERSAGAALGTDDFVFLALGTGLGAGIVLNGQLHHGAHWAAGELGYMLGPDLSPEPLALDRPGVLESAVGGKAIEQVWKQSTSGKTSLRATEIFDRARAGDPVAGQVLTQTAEHLATAITNLSLVLDTTLVILGGGVGHHPALRDAVEQAVAQNQFASPEVVLSSLGDQAQIHGAIWVALQAAEARDFRQAKRLRRKAPAPKSLRTVELPEE
jgi:glucokinase